MDALWDILAYSEYQHWKRICFLYDQNHKWSRVLVRYKRKLPDVINELDDCELALWLRDRKSRNENYGCICERSRQNVFHRMADCDGPRAFVIGAKFGYLDLLKYLLPTVKKEDLILAFRNGAEFGHLEILKWLKSLVVYEEHYAYRWAARNNHLGIVQWLAAEIGPDPDIRWTFSWAVGYADLDMMIWLKDHYRLRGLNILDVQYYPYTNAAKRGDIDIFRWLKDEFQTTRYEILGTQVMHYAAISGHLRLCQWLWNMFNLNHSVFGTDTLMLAAHFGHLNICKWLVEIIGFHEGYGHAFVSAASDGRLEVVMWFARKFSITEEFINHGFRRAVLFDQLEVCKWIVNWYNWTTNEGLIHEGILRGNLRTVKWLMERLWINISNISEMFSNAVKSGNLDMVKWLHETYLLRCPDECFVRTTKIEIIEWLDTNFEITCHLDAFQQAACDGNLHICKWIMKHYEIDVNDVAFELKLAFGDALKNGEVEVLEWILKKFKLERTFNVGDIGHFYYIAAVHNPEMVDWLDVKI